MSDPLFLRSTNDAPVNLHQIVSVLIRKGPGPKVQLSPSEVWSRLRGDTSQLAGGPSGPGSQTLPSSHHWGGQVPNPTGSQAPKAIQMGQGQVPQVVTYRLAALSLQRRAWGRHSRLPRGLSQGQWAALVRALGPYRAPPSAYSPGPPALTLARGLVSRRVLGRGWDPPLISLSHDKHSTTSWRNPPTKGRSATAGWCGQGPLRAEQQLSQTHRQVNRARLTAPGEGSDRLQTLFLALRILSLGHRDPIMENS